MQLPGSPFVQFTYGLVSPIPKYGAFATMPFEAQASPPVLLNLPPARVWTYRSLEGRPMAGRTGPIDLIDRLKLGGEKIGEEWREHRDRLRAEWVALSQDAMADWRARARKVKMGFANQRVRGKRDDAARSDPRAERRQRW